MACQCPLACRARQPAREPPRRRRSRAARCIHDCGGPVRSSRQPAQYRRAGRMRGVPRSGAETPDRRTGARSFGEFRIRRTGPPWRYAAKATVRARQGGAPSRGQDHDRLLPPEPAEHLHRQADRGDAGFSTGALHSPDRLRPARARKPAGRRTYPAFPGIRWSLIVFTGRACLRFHLVPPRLGARVGGIRFFRARHHRHQLARTSCFPTSQHESRGFRACSGCRRCTERGRKLARPTRHNHRQPDRTPPCGHARVAAPTRYRGEPGERRPSGCTRDRTRGRDNLFRFRLLPVPRRTLVDACNLSPRGRSGDPTASFSY